jgi:PIN domain nuclease of toxin-antitoxin system
MIDDPNSGLVFSAASLWEITIRHGLGQDDFQVDPGPVQQV